MKKRNFLTDEQQTERLNDVNLYLENRRNKTIPSNELAKILIENPTYQERKKKIKLNKKLSIIESKNSLSSNEPITAVKMEQEVINTSLVAQTFEKAQINYSLGTISEGKLKEIQQKATQLVQEALQDGPNGIKKRVEIKNIGIDMPKSRLLQQKMGTLTKSSDEHHAGTGKMLMNLGTKMENEMGVMISGKTKPIRWLTSFIPFVGDRVKDSLLNQEKVSNFIESIQTGLDKTQKELQNQITELESQKNFLKEDAEQLLMDFYLIKMIGQEVETYIQGVSQKNGTITTNTQLMQDELHKNLLVPVMQKSLAIGERIAVDHNYYMTLSTLQQNAQNLEIAVQKADQVTMHALQNVITAKIASHRQGEIMNSVQNLNDITSKLIKDTSQIIREQSKTMAENTVKNSLNVEDIKNAMKNIQESVEEVNKVYRDSLPGFKSNIAALTEIIEEGNKRIESAEHADDIKDGIL